MNRLRALGQEAGDRIRAFPPRIERARSGGEIVILLHGLGRTRMSLLVLERVLRHAGYTVINHTYPSKSGPVPELASVAVGESIAAARARGPSGAPIHFVGHSMGGLLLRAWFAGRDHEGFGRAVMLAPPNRGSEIVDQLHRLGLAEPLLGPAGAALGTNEDAAPQRLPDLPLDYGVIAGNRSLNPLTSAMTSGEDDGKVSVARTLLPGAKDHIVLPVSHTLMMNEPMTIWQTAHFIKRGAFNHRARLSRL